MITKIKVYLGIALAFAVTVLLAFVKGRSSGKNEIMQEVSEKETEAVKEVATKQVENAKVVKNVQKEVIASVDKTVDSELLNEWTRK